MKTIASVLAVTAAAMLLLAGIIFGLGDREVFVSPPDAVAEQFMRKLETGRYARALDHLDENLRARLSEETLREATRRLKSRVGEIEDVRGEPGSMQQDTAEASAVLKTAGGREVPIRFRLSRRQGAWTLSDLGDLREDGATARH